MNGELLNIQKFEPPYNLNTICNVRTQVQGALILTGLIKKQKKRNHQQSVPCNDNFVQCYSRYIKKKNLSAV